MNLDMLGPPAPPVRHPATTLPIEERGGTGDYSDSTKEEVKVDWREEVRRKEEEEIAMAAAWFLINLN